MIVNFLSGSKVYIVEPLTVLRNTNMDLNFTFTVGWRWVGGWVGVLNFIEIHCKIYKKLSLSRNPNPYLVIPKYCKIRHLNFSPVNEENWRKEHCLNQGIY